MTQPGAMLYTQGFGSRPENVEVPHIDTRDPQSYDINFPLGKRWINKNDNGVFTLTALQAFNAKISATWTSSSSSGVSSISATTGSANPTDGIVSIVGNGTPASGTGIVTSATGNTVTLKLGTTLSGLAQVTSTNVQANLLAIAGGSTGSSGTSSAMVTGAVTVSNAQVKTSSIVFCTPKTLGTLTAPQAYYISAISSGSFTITSAYATDTSIWNYVIINVA